MDTLSFLCSQGISCKQSSFFFFFFLSVYGIIGTLTCFWSGYLIRYCCLFEVFTAPRALSTFFVLSAPPQVLFPGILPLQHHGDSHLSVVRAPPQVLLPCFSVVAVSRVLSTFFSVRAPSQVQSPFNFFLYLHCNTKGTHAFLCSQGTTRSTVAFQHRLQHHGYSHPPL